MLEVAADAEVAHDLAELIAAQITLQFIQPVFTQNVEALALEGAEGAQSILQQSVLSAFHVQVQRTEIGLELRYFLAFEIHGETQCLIERAELRFAVLWDESVAIAGIQAQETEFHFGCKVVGP